MQCHSYINYFKIFYLLRLFPAWTVLSFFVHFDLHVHKFLLCPFHLTYLYFPLYLPYFLLLSTCFCEIVSSFFFSFVSFFIFVLSAYLWSLRVFNFFKRTKNPFLSNYSFIKDYHAQVYGWILNSLYCFYSVTLWEFLQFCWLLGTSLLVKNRLKNEETDSVWSTAV